MPNATIQMNDIHKNVTTCSNKTAMYSFDPKAALQRELNASGHSNINLTDLNWPSAVDDGLAALRVAQRAVFVLYCIGIGLIAVAFAFAILSIFFAGRLSAFVNVLLDWLAFLAIGLASAIATAILVKAADLINKDGNDVGISATKGSKFLTLTWVATALMFVSSLVWCGECIVGRKRKANRGYADEPKF